MTIKSEPIHFPKRIENFFREKQIFIPLTWMHPNSDEAESPNVLIAQRATYIGVETTIPTPSMTDV
jgi:hypothetical protein